MRKLKSERPTIDAEALRGKLGEIELKLTEIKRQEEELAQQARNIALGDFLVAKSVLTETEADEANETLEGLQQLLISKGILVLKHVPYEVFVPVLLTEEYIVKLKAEKLARDVEDATPLSIIGGVKENHRTVVDINPKGEAYQALIDQAKKYIEDNNQDLKRKRDVLWNEKRALGQRLYDTPEEESKRQEWKKEARILLTRALRSFISQLRSGNGVVGFHFTPTWRAESWTNKANESDPETYLRMRVPLIGDQNSIQVGYIFHPIFSPFDNHNREQVSALGAEEVRSLIDAILIETEFTLDELKLRMINLRIKNGLKPRAISQEKDLQLIELKWLQEGR